MKPHFILLCLLFLSVLGCSKLDSPPIDAKVIGCGYLQQTNDSLYLQIGSTKYLATVVYTGEHHHRNNSHTIITPINDLPVTCFSAKIFNYPQFILGHKNARQIEEIFKENYTLALVFFSVLIISALISLRDVIFSSKKQNKYFLD